MRLEIYDAKAEEVNDSPLVKLQLVEDQDRGDTINLVAIDEEGETWYLMGFDTDGRATAIGGIPEELGFMLDDDSALEIYPSE